MLLKYLQPSKVYNTKINDLRIQVVSFFFFKLLMSYTSMFYNEIHWNYSLAGSYQAGKVGIDLTTPRFTSQFDYVSSGLNFLFSLIGLLAAINPTNEYQIYLLPDIIWNTYTVTSHFQNIWELSCDIFQLASHGAVACNLFLTGSFTTSCHILFILEIIILYNNLSYVPIEEGVTLSDIRKHFRIIDNILKPETGSSEDEDDFQSLNSSF